MLLLHSVCFVRAQNMRAPAPVKDLAEIKLLPESAEKIQQVVRYARDPRIIITDEVKNLIEEAYQTALKLNNDELKVATLSTKAIVELNFGNQDLAINLIKQAEGLKENLNEPQVIALYSDFTRIYNRIGDFDKIFFYYDRLEELTKNKPQFIIQRVFNLRNRTNIELRLGNVEKVKSNYLLAINLAKDSKNPNLLKDTRFGYANTLLNLNRDDEAFVILKDLIPDLENTITDKTAQFFEILSRNYEKSGDYESALKYAEKSFNLPNATVQQKANSISKMMLFCFLLKKFENYETNFLQLKKYDFDPNSLTSKKQYQLAEARYYDFKGQNGLAKAKYLSVYRTKIANQISPNFDFYALLGLANVYTREGKRDSTQLYFNKAASVLTKYKLPTIFKLSYVADFNAFSKNPAIVQDTLVKNLQQEMLLKDTLFQMRLSKLTNELETKYRVNEKEKALILASKIQQLQKLELKQQRAHNLLIIIGAAIALLILTSFAIILFQRKKQAAILNSATLNDLKKQHQINIMNTLSEAQELEKKRIAERLHDEVGAMLSIAKLNINTLREQAISADADTNNKLKVTQRLMNDISETVRNISHDLMPIALEKYGFKAAILDLLTSIRTANSLTVEHVIEGFENTIDWPQNFVLSTYRIIQEILNNAIKHAQATHLFIQIIELDKAITIYVEDNGKGIDMSKNEDGAGIKLLRTNIDYLAGKLEIDGKPNEGTFVLIELPLPNRNES